MRVSLADATGGSIGWLWAGVPLATTDSASTVRRTRRWAVDRGNGYNSAALYAGAGDGWDIAWDVSSTLGGRLTQADAEQLLGVVDWAQQQDEPLIFIPHHLHPQDASLVLAGSDAIEVADIHEYQPSNSAQRRLSASLKLDPLYT